MGIKSGSIVLPQNQLKSLRVVMCLLRNLTIKPYIEYGFRYGKKSFKETKVIENTKFPFQLSFNNKPAIKTTIRIRENQLLKFDSCDASWGFLKKAELPDTIILDINIEGEKIQTGFIKVW
jgi:hypothetical protein